MYKQANNLRAIQKHYKGFIFDLWGVIHDGFTPYPGVVPLINQLIAEQYQIIFLSNAPRPGAVLMKKLTDFGINMQPEMILSSGDLIREQLKDFSDPIYKTLGKRFYHLGASRNQDILSEIAVDVTEDLTTANFILVTAYMDPEENLQQYDQLLQQALALKLPLICANPDKEVINGDKIRYCAGVIAEKYEKMGGVVHYYGKPYVSIFNQAIARMNKNSLSTVKNGNLPLEKKKILMIGDTLETDILGAKKAGIDSALMLTGNIDRILTAAKEKLLKESKKEIFNPEKFLQDLFKAQNIYPNWVLPSLA